MSYLETSEEGMFRNHNPRMIIQQKNHHVILNTIHIYIRLQPTTHYNQPLVGLVRDLIYENLELYTNTFELKQQQQPKNSTHCELLVWATTSLQIHVARHCELFVPTFYIAIPTVSLPYDHVTAICCYCLLWLSEKLQN